MTTASASRVRRFRSLPLLARLINHASLERHPRLVLEAPPGAGKTTQVPPALLDASWLGARKILMLEPRRIAARAAAEFMAAQRGESVGETIGYRIRFENRVSAATRIEVVTEGILTRMIQDDPELPGVGAILFDEFHERHLTRRSRRRARARRAGESPARSSSRVMSATLRARASSAGSTRLGSRAKAAVFRCASCIRRAGPERERTVVLRRAVAQALAENDGDVLVFLPGKREIEQARRALEPRFQDERGERADEAIASTRSGSGHTILIVQRAHDENRNHRAARRTLARRATCRSRACDARNATRSACHERRRVEPDAARRARGR